MGYSCVGLFFERRLDKRSVEAAVKLLYGIILLVVLVSGCVTAPVDVVGSGRRPSWLDNPQSKYPLRYYLTAVGEGDSLKDAQSVAVGNLAKIFRSDIKVEEHLQERYFELMGDKNSYQEKSQFDRDVRISSGMSLVNVQYAESYKNSVGRIYALAYINRHQTSEIYVTRLEENDARTVSFIEKAKNRTPTVEYASLSAAVAISSDSQLLLEQLDVISPVTKKATNMSYDYDQLLQQLAEAAGRVHFMIEVTGDQSEKVVGALKSLVTDMGFVIDKSASLKINAKILFEDTELKRGDLSFVRYEARIDVLDISGQTVVSVSKRGREGHVSKSEAEARCVRTIASLVDRDLKIKLQAYFDGLVK